MTIPSEPNPLGKAAVYVFFGAWFVAIPWGFLAIMFLGSAPDTVWRLFWLAGVVPSFVVGRHVWHHHVAKDRRR